MVREQLRALGQRWTPARAAVLDVIGSTDAHLSADQISHAVSEHLPDVHRATVFRVLDRMVELGVIAHVHLPHGATTYHLRTHNDPMHLHVRCRTCERVFDVDPDVLDDAARDLADSIGFQLDADHVALSGRCQDCSTEPAAPDTE
ncbi:MAG: Fur family transcriptional regulator [Acidimicrobiales bacterium]